MNELKLKLVNYQNHSNSEFTFKQGINCIIGSSSSGKSAVFRAMETALYNLPRSGHVKQGTKLCRVGISYKGHTAFYQRDLTASSQVRYMLDGQELKKVGRNPVIDTPLGFQEVEINGSKYHLNFVRQMAYPFLLDQTPSTMYQVVIQSKTSDSLNKVNSNIKGDIQSLKVELTENNAVLNVYKDNATSLLSKVNKAVEPVKKLDKLIMFGSAVGRLQVLRDNCISYNEVKIPKEPSEVPVAIKWDSSVEELNSLISELIALKIPKEPSFIEETPALDTSNSFVLETLLNEYHSLTIRERPSEISSMEEPNFLVGLFEGIAEIKSLDFLMSKKEETYESLLSDLERVEEGLSEFKVCPYCGSQIHERNECNG